MSWVNESVVGRKLWIKLMDHVSEHVGAWSRAPLIKRDALAEAEAARINALMEEQIRQDIDRIKNGEAVFTNGKLLGAPAPNDGAELSVKGDRRIDPYFSYQPATVTEFMQVAEAQTEALKLERSLALHRITRFAGEEADLHEDDSTVSDEPIDPDWFARWRAGAQDVRSEDMQRLWAKVLAGETRTPGAFSLRSLDVLTKLSKSDAEAISRIAPYVFRGRIFWDKENEALDYTRPSYDDILYLSELGIVNGAETLGLTATYETTSDSSYSNGFIIHQRGIVIEHNDPSKRLNIPILNVTRVGRELVGLGKFSADESYLKALAMYVKQQGFDVFIGDVIEYTGSNAKFGNCIQV